MRYLCKSFTGGLISDFLLSIPITSFQSQYQVSRTSLAIIDQSKVHQPTPRSADWRNKAYVFAQKLGSSLLYQEQTKEKQIAAL
jgi:hypothetical protein